MDSTLSCSGEDIGDGVLAIGFCCNGDRRTIGDRLSDVGLKTFSGD
jgi:hypothetical protein